MALGPWPNNSFNPNLPARVGKFRCWACASRKRSVSKKISGLLGKLGLGRMSSGEYQANLNGLNMFFGVILGLALTGTEKFNAWQFGVILAGIAGTAISILYRSSSKSRVAYSIYALVSALIFPELMDYMLRGHGLVPDKIRLTLLVWPLMTVCGEFWARDKDHSTCA